MNSAIRRHHYYRLKKKRQSYWGFTWREGDINPIVINTPKACSCIMCGNPRKYWNQLTKQEVISNFYIKELKEEYGQICDTNSSTLGFY